MNDISIKILHGFAENSVNLDIFDSVALLAMECLFSVFFPRYLSMKGQSIPILKKVTATYLKGKLYIQDTGTSSARDLDATFDFSDSAFKKWIKSNRKAFTYCRKSMVQILSTPDAYMALKNHAKVFWLFSIN